MKEGRARHRVDAHRSGRANTATPTKTGSAAEFRYFLTAHAVSQVGTQISRVALPLVALITLHASPFEVGAVSALQSVGFLLVGLPAGVWLNRREKRLAMVLSDIVRAAIFASLPVAEALHVLTLPQLLLVVMAGGTATAFFDVAYQSYVPTLVSPERLVRSNARLETARSITQIGGPGLAGVLLQLMDAPWVITVDAVSFVFSALCLSRIRWRAPAAAAPPQRSLRAEVATGLGFTLRHPVLRAMAASSALSSFFSSQFVAAQIPFLTREVALSPQAMGLFMSAGLVGGLLGAASAAPLARRLGLARANWQIPLMTWPVGLVVPFARAGAWAALFTVGVAVCMFGGMVNNVTQATLRQSMTPAHLLSRVTASSRFLSWGMLPLGGLVGGALAQLVGARTTILVAEIGGAVAALPLMFSPLRRDPLSAAGSDSTSVARTKADVAGAGPACRPGATSRSSSLTRGPQAHGGRAGRTGRRRRVVSCFHSRGRDDDVDEPGGHVVHEP